MLFVKYKEKIGSPIGLDSLESGKGEGALDAAL